MRHKAVSFLVLRSLQSILLVVSVDHFFLPHGGRLCCDFLFNVNIQTVPSSLHGYYET